MKTVFQSTVPMSTYLLAWVVSDFKVKSNEDESFNTWAREDIIEGAGMSQEVGPKALEELHQYTGIPFELPKTDQFAIPDFSAGAMENWGLVTYRYVARVAGQRPRAYPPGESGKGCGWLA